MARLYTYKITLSNTTSTATPPNLQVRLNINFSAIRGLSVDLGNIRFSSDQAGNNLLYAWLESAPQGTFTQGSSVSSYTSSNVWVNLGNNIIPANGSLNIYMQVLSSGTKFDGAYWGANPLWTSTYGQYDNGANVFNNYWNFAGTSLPSGWQEPQTAGVTVDNGVSFAPGSNYGYIETTAKYPIGDFVDANFNVTTIGDGGLAMTVDINGNAYTSDHWINVGSASGYMYNGTVADLRNSEGSASALDGSYTATNPFDSTGSFIGSVVTTSSEYYIYKNYNTLIGDTTTNIPPQGNYFIMVGGGGNGVVFSINWIRTRAYPPNGTDPVLTSVQIILLSNYTSASIPSPEWTTLSGKPYVTVSAKGISNGLSNIPNDGADFGPDTPGTQTCGIQEACNYAYNNGYAVHLTTGIFNINATIQIPGPLQISGSGGVPGMNEIINGVYDPYTLAVSGPVTVIKLTTAADWVFQNTNYMSGMSITHLIIDCNLLGNGIQFTCPSPVPNNGNFDFTGTTIIDFLTAGADFSGYGDLQLIGLLIDSDTTESSSALIIGGGNCTVRIYSVNIYTGNTVINSYTNQVLFFGGLIQSIIAQGNNGEISIFGSRFTDIIPTPGTFISQINIIGADPATSPINLANFTATSTVIAQMNIYGAFITGNSTTFFSNVASGVNALSTIENLNIEGLVALNVFTDLPDALYVSTGLGGYGAYYLHKYSYPANPTSTTSGTTAGTVTQVQTSYTTSYKKFMFAFNGYENDTATNQSITFLNAFSTIASITSNTTGLAITATTTGITITAPNNTTLYSGIVIVEGY
ncbi:MAG: hypothetical protein QXQ64_10350 [Candidatus Bathyarchaeia archaeon]